MEKVFTAKLKGGTSSTVFFTKYLSKLEEKLKGYGDNVLFVFDENTKALIDVPDSKSIVLPSGEMNKNYESIDLILKKALSLSLSRDSIFIAIGGGVICDMTAFASSIYMRGARAVLVPTTLLSMVDASVGGKSGIDYEGYKNLVGTFFPAEEIIICLEALNTLSEKEYLCGLGEVVKHAFLSPDERLYSFMDSYRDEILSRDISTMYEMVKLSLEVKKYYIELDPEEKKGIRSFLNLGHTFGHALESITNYSISHGEGVVWGVYKALAIGCEIGITSDEYTNKAYSLLKKYPFNVDWKVSEENLPEFMEAISKDKKKSNGSVKFVLLERQGVPTLQILSDEQIVSVVI